MLRSGLIFGAVAFVLGLAVTLVSPICGPCVAIMVGLSAGYLAGVFSIPRETNAAVKSGAAAGALGAVGGLVGQMIGGVINAVFLGPDQAGAIMRGWLGLPAAAGSTAPDSLYYAGALGIPCCVGLFDVALMAILGALGGILWYQIKGRHLSTA